jgi:hypothetical protein
MKPIAKKPIRDVLVIVKNKKTGHKRAITSDLWTHASRNEDGATTLYTETGRTATHNQVNRAMVGWYCAEHGLDAEDHVGGLLVRQQLPTQGPPPPAHPARDDAIETMRSQIEHLARRVTQIEKRLLRLPEIEPIEGGLDGHVLFGGDVKLDPENVKAAARRAKGRAKSKRVSHSPYDLSQVKR